MAEISSGKEFSKSKKGWYKRWTAEIDAAQKAQEKWIKAGTKTVSRYLAEKKAFGDDMKSLNLFHANVSTLRAMLFGTSPKVDVDRTNADANDDAARVAAEMMERMLNIEFEDPGSTTKEDLQGALEDRLLPGLGTVRVRYEVETETTEYAAITTVNESGEEVELAPSYSEDSLLSETAPTDYVHWKDFLWSPAKTWPEVRWVAFKVRMTPDEAAKRFGKKIAKKLPTGKDSIARDNEDDLIEEFVKDAWNRITLWEIWCKEHRTVYWICPGYDDLLDEQEDPLQLQGFFPCPRPMIANATTSAFMPTPDFKFSEGLYNSIDELTTRISILTDAIRMVGVYDTSNSELAQMLGSSMDNVMIPVDNWAAFAEKGGIKGQVDWLPIEMVSNVLSTLTEKRQQDISLLNDITGMSDILRGASSGPVKSSAEKTLEAKFGSVRVQSLQDQFADFASQLMRIKAEIISIHFDDETIVGQSNAQNSMDAELIPQALELLRNPAEFAWRVAIKPESVAMVDYAQLKEERVEYIQSISLFLQSALGLAEYAPESVPVLLEMLKWGMAGFKGSSQIEGVLDRAIQGLQQQGQEDEKPDADKQKSEATMAEIQAKSQARLAEITADKEAKLEVIQAELRKDIQKFDNEANRDVQEANRKHQMELREIQAEMEAEIEVRLAEKEAELEELREEHRLTMRELEEQREKKVYSEDED
jgi:hypothetical protein